MNAKQARAQALYASALQVEALLEAEFVYDGFLEADQPKVQRELEHIADRLMARAQALDPTITDHVRIEP